MPEPMKDRLWHDLLCKQGLVTWPVWMRVEFRQEPFHEAVWDRVQNPVFDQVFWRVAAMNAPISENEEAEKEEVLLEILSELVKAIKLCRGEIAALKEALEQKE